jgi:hypothetical protein
MPPWRHLLSPLLVPHLPVTLSFIFHAAARRAIGLAAAWTGGGAAAPLGGEECWARTAATRCSKSSKSRSNSSWRASSSRMAWVWVAEGAIGWTFEVQSRCRCVHKANRQLAPPGFSPRTRSICTKAICARSYGHVENAGELCRRHESRGHWKHLRRGGAIGAAWALWDVCFRSPLAADIKGGALPRRSMDKKRLGCVNWSVAPHPTRSGEARRYGYSASLMGRRTEWSN